MEVGLQGRIIFADNMNKKLGVPSLEDESVALVFTSPPYWNYVDYLDKAGTGYENTYQDYIYQLGKLFNEIQKKIIHGGRFVINVSNMKSRKSIEGESFVYPIVSDVIDLARQAEMTFFDEIIWIKGGANAGALGGKPLFGSYPHPPTPKILDSIFENILVFTKDGKRSKVSKEIKERSKLTKDEWRCWTSGIWNIPTGKDMHHPATFPIELATRVIRLYSFVGDVVLDPFAGTGTTIISADKNERKGIGFEISKGYKGAIRDKELKWLTQLTLPNVI